MLHRVATLSCRGHVDELATEPFMLLHRKHGTGYWWSWNCCDRRTRFIVIWKHFCFILSTGTRIWIDSVTRTRSSTRGCNTSASVTVTVGGKWYCQSCVLIQWLNCLCNLLAVGNVWCENCNVRPCRSAGDCWGNAEGSWLPRPGGHCDQQWRHELTRVCLRHLAGCRCRRHECQLLRTDRCYKGLRSFTSVQSLTLWLLLQHWWWFWLDLLTNILQWFSVILVTRLSVEGQTVSRQDTQTCFFAPVTLTLTQWPWYMNSSEIFRRCTSIPKMNFLGQDGGKQDFFIDFRVWHLCPINVSLPPLH